jgi:hypothetical protein
MNKGFELLSTFRIQQQNGEDLVIGLFKVIDYTNQPNKTMTNYVTTYQISIKDFTIEYSDITKAKQEYLICIQNLLFPKKEEMKDDKN